MPCPVCGCHHHHEGEEHEHHHHHHEGEEHEHHHHHHEGEEHEHHHHAHGHHHADEIFTSWGKETIRTYTREEIEYILKELEQEEKFGTVLRAKGMVAGEDGNWIYFDMVPEDQEVRSGAPEYTGRICVIGSKLQEEKLEKLFGLAE